MNGDDRTSRIAIAARILALLGCFVLEVCWFTAALQLRCPSALRLVWMTRPWERKFCEGTLSKETLH